MMSAIECTASASMELQQPESMDNGRLVSGCIDLGVKMYGERGLME